MMGSKKYGAEIFIRKLKENNPELHGRRWLFVPYDQLTDRIGPLSNLKPDKVGLLMVENHSLFRLRPFHKQKLALLMANMRHFALEQAARGVAIEYHFSEGLFRDSLRSFLREHGTITTMEPAEYQLQQDLKPLVDEGVLKLVPHEGWLTSSEDFVKSQSDKPPWRMDSFYRFVRRQSGIMMEGKKPLGGKFSYDADNRKPWSGEPPAPEIPKFSNDPVKEEVGEAVEKLFPEHPGILNLETLPATKNDSSDLWDWAKRECLVEFGPYEDAMSVQSSNIFHTRISSLVNIHRLLPEQVLNEASSLDLPLNSKEGFVRQVLGWREFMRHVHRVTRGFREVPQTRIQVLPQPADGGYQRWSGKAWKLPRSADQFDGGATPSELGASNPLLPAFWGKPSGLNCLDCVVSDVWKEGYSHHITRLMILSNIATLLDISPRELTDWFWIAYTDAYDWVVEPNVLGMGTFALGNLFTTKPYISGSAYINRMSDYCSFCQFNPKKDCPIARWYWSFLARHYEQLSQNPRIGPVLRSLQRRSRDQVDEDQKTFEVALTALEKGEPLSPELFA